MTGTLHQMLAQEHVKDLLRSAESERRASLLPRRSRSERAIFVPLRRRRGRHAISRAQALPAAEKP
jgi:hypothetical protein